MNCEILEQNWYFMLLSGQLWQFRLFTLRLCAWQQLTVHAREWHGYGTLQCVSFPHCCVWKKRQPLEKQQKYGIIISSWLACIHPERTDTHTKARLLVWFVYNAASFLFVLLRAKSKYTFHMLFCARFHNCTKNAWRRKHVCLCVYLTYLYLSSTAMRCVLLAHITKSK